MIQYSDSEGRPTEAAPQGSLARDRSGHLWEQIAPGASEFGKNYFNAGMNNESWEYGGSYQKMRLTMATGLQILRYPQFLIAAYYLVQNETGSDGRSDEQNYGAYLSDGQATFGLDDLTRVGGGIVAADQMTAGD